MPGEPALREPSPADAGAIAGLLNEHAHRLYGEAELSVEEVAHWFALPNVWIRVAERGGRIAGYLDVADENAEGTHFDLDARTLEREVAAALVAAGVARAREHAGPGAVARGYVASTDEVLVDAYEDAGFRPVRRSFQLRIDLGRPVSAPSWPDGIAVRTYRPEDEDAVYEAHMEAFADHWDFRREARGEWRAWTLERPSFDPSLWLLAVDGDDVAGVALCQWHPSGDPAFGWVNVLGVRPRWRRRGLARALLLHAFGEFARRGATRVGLGVDAESTTGALELYEGAGMRVVRRSDTWELGL